MQIPGVIIQELPSLRNPIMIAGFDGWGNALNVSKAMAAYLIRNLNAVAFARLNPDTYYRFDEHRPVVTIEDGELRNLVSPGGAFYAAHTPPPQRDVVILEAVEPSLSWYQFADALLDLARQLKVELLVTLGSMYDNLLHTDRLISGVCSDASLQALLREKRVASISYEGPSAIHSVILSEARRREIPSISLWCHCPFYLQGTTHFGQLLQLAALLADLGNFTLALGDLEVGWQKLREQIEAQVEKNSELQRLIGDLRKRRVKGSAASVKTHLKSDDKVIHLQDFFDPGWPVDDAE